LVKEIESGKCSVSQTSINFNVSLSSLYELIGRYSRYLQDKYLPYEQKEKAEKEKPTRITVNPKQT
jgi:hypothetical protein